MTEKRFTRIVCSNDEYTGSLFCDDEPLKIDEVCKLLNELHEEKEQLQSRCNDYNVALKTLQDLTERKLKENEQLKKLLERPHCRKCFHFSCDSADNYCIKKGYGHISDCNVAKHCTDYESVFE